MSRAIKTAGSILSLGILLVAFNLGGSAGCGSSGTSGGGTTAGTDDATVTATSDDALAVGAAAEVVAFNAVSSAVAGAGAGLVLSDNKGAILAALKNAITITETSSCTDGGVPSPSGDLFSGSISGSVSGTCTVTADGTETDLSVLVDCDNFNSGDDSENITLDGAIGVEATLQSSADTTEFELGLGTDGLVVTLADDSNCSVVMDLTATVTVDDTGSGTVGISGCVTVCGEGFAASGSESI